MKGLLPFYQYEEENVVNYIPKTYIPRLIRKNTREPERMCFFTRSKEPKRTVGKGEGVKGTNWATPNLAQ